MGENIGAIELRWPVAVELSDHVRPEILLRQANEESPDDVILIHPEDVDSLIVLLNLARTRARGIRRDGGQPR